MDILIKDGGHGGNGHDIIHQAGELYGKKKGKVSADDLYGYSSPNCVCTYRGRNYKVNIEGKVAK